jgi:hypothetical protein
MSSVLSSRLSESPPPPIIGNKHEHDVIADSSLLDDEEVFEVHIAKAQKITQNTGQPKAGDYDPPSRELILSAANTYRVLLATQGAFPMSSEELELVKKAWKRVNDDGETTPMALTPDITRIVSFFIVFLSLFPVA